MSTIRPVLPDDDARLLEFFGRVPMGDRTFFKEDVLDPATMRGWSQESRSRRSVVLGDDGSIVGYVAVIPLFGWSSHVAELRLVVDPGYRRRGLGRQLAQGAVVEAAGMGLAKLVVEVVAEQEAAVAMFQQLGFQAEALLADHVRDSTGHVHDLLILAHRVDENWSLLTSFGVGSA